MSVERVDTAIAGVWPERKLKPAEIISPAGSAPLKDKRLAAPAAAQVTAEQVRDAVNEINRLLADGRRELAFSVDETSGRTVVRVIDAASGDVLRQIPSEEVLKLASRLQTGEPLPSLGLEQWS